MKIVRTEKEIFAVLDKITKNKNEGQSDYPAMSYEEGAEYMLFWLTDHQAEPVFESM